MNDVVVIYIEEVVTSVLITVDELDENINLTVGEIIESIVIEIQDVGIKGDSGLGAQEAQEIQNRLSSLETGIGDTDFDFENEVTNFLSF